jgi:hypothetical protein
MTTVPRSKSVVLNSSTRKESKRSPSPTLSQHRVGQSGEWAEAERDIIDPSEASSWRGWPRGRRRCAVERFVWQAAIGFFGVANCAHSTTWPGGTPPLREPLEDTRSDWGLISLVAAHTHGEGQEEPCGRATSQGEGQADQAQQGGSQLHKGGRLRACFMLCQELSALQNNRLPKSMTQKRSSRSSKPSPRMRSDRTPLWSHVSSPDAGF